MEPIRIDIPNAPGTLSPEGAARLGRLRFILDLADVHFDRAGRNVMIRQAVEFWIGDFYTDDDLLRVVRNVRIMNPSLRKGPATWADLGGNWNPYGVRRPPG